MLGEAGRDSRSARGAKRRTDREHRSHRGGRGRGQARGRWRGPRVDAQPDRLGTAAAEAADAAAAGHARPLADLVVEARSKAGSTTAAAARTDAGAAAEGTAHVHARLAAAVAALPLPARLLVDDVDAGAVGEDYATAVRLVTAATAHSSESVSEEPKEPVAQPEAPETQQTQQTPEVAPSEGTDADTAAEEALDELLAM